MMKVKVFFGTGFVTHLTTQINCERFYMQADMGFTKIHKPPKKIRQIKYIVKSGQNFSFSEFQAAKIGQVFIFDYFPKW